MKLLVAIPALNEEKTIAQVVKNIPKYISGSDTDSNATDSNKVEILVINDGSTDLTEAEAKKAGAEVITNHATEGLGKVFECATHEALKRKADIMVMIDGDGQFDPHNIPELVVPISGNDADVITCTRFRNKNLTPEMPLAKKWGNKFLALFLSKLTGQKLTDVACGFRAYSREALLNLNLFGKFTYTQETLLQLLFKGFRLKEVPLKVKGKREFGHSKISGNLFKYGWRSFKIIFRVVRDYRPLKYIGSLGILIFLIGLGFDIFVLRHYIATGAFTPFKSLSFLGGFLTAVGLLIFTLGLIADMLNRIRETQEKILAFEKRKFYGAYAAQTSVPENHLPTN